MRRGAVLILVALVLVTVAGAARLHLEGGKGEDPPAALLYLPEGPFLRALAFGHEETLADLLYIWSIQYYSNYDDESRFDYLAKVYHDAIPELDPLFTEVYLVGAMIMSWEAKNTDMALRLYDKALVEMPGNWEVAYWAGWECYNVRRYARARDYWSRAAETSGAPPQLIRLAARMLEKAGSLEDAIAEYQHILEDPPDDRTAVVVERWLRHTQSELMLEQTREAIARFREVEGRCPVFLEDLVRKGLISRVPVDLSGETYSYDPAGCEVLSPAGDALEMP